LIYFTIFLKSANGTSFVNTRSKANFNRLITYEESAMAEMTFFSNPQCKNSEQKRNHLESAGNKLFWKDLTTHRWTHDELLPYVRGRSPLDIMNSSAPDILMGKIDPLLLTFEQALTLLVEKPALIKGPLVHADNLYIQGLQDKRLNKFLGKKLKNKSASIFRINSRQTHAASQKWQPKYTSYADLSYSIA
jgi:arsenate reductase-like glutaredoxin family protein